MTFSEDPPRKPAKMISIHFDTELVIAGLQSTQPLEGGGHSVALKDCLNTWQPFRATRPDGMASQESNIPCAIEISIARPGTQKH
jgi:hypothetical protein